MPLSRAMAYNRREPEVMQPMVPLTKQMASMTVMKTAAARLLTASYMSWVMAMPVFVPKTSSGFVKAKSMTRINAVPLFKSAIRLHVGLVHELTLSHQQ